MPTPCLSSLTRLPQRRLMQARARATVRDNSWSVLLRGLDRPALNFNTRLEHRFKTLKFTVDEPGQKHVLEQMTQRRIKQAHPVMQTALAEATENNW